MQYRSWRPQLGSNACIFFRCRKGRGRCDRVSCLAFVSDICVWSCAGLISGIFCILLFLKGIIFLMRALFLLYKGDKFVITNVMRVMSAAV